MRNFTDINMNEIINSNLCMLLKLRDQKYNIEKRGTKNQEIFLKGLKSK